MLLILLPVLIQAQSKKQKRAIEASKKADQKIIQNIVGHVRYLADDKLEGRQTGTPGEMLAMKYIVEQFKAVGLQPKGSIGYFQPFTIDEGRQIDLTSTLSIDGNALKLHTEFFPLTFSAEKTTRGNSAIGLREAGQPWYLDIKEMIESNVGDPHYNLKDQIKKEAAKLASRKATALLVYNSGRMADNLHFDPKDTSAALTIPIIYVTKPAYEKYLADPFATLDLSMKVIFYNKTKTGNNVAGYIDNGAAQTIIIGAHYDHLGFGEGAIALDTMKTVHNGADDNASGVAAMIELARILTGIKSNTNNYLFIAFSGEELGLLGSKYWLENRTTELQVNYMINLDMVGRYNATRMLTIGGYGTSPEWASIFNSIKDEKIVIKFDSTGGGPSDHASFYRKDIPVLFFFTGSHTDYHKSTDDWDKINFEGQLQIVKLINRVIQSTENKARLTFTKTAEPNLASTNFSVSLGIIPDYAFNGMGLRIDGVSYQKTAERLGMKPGDVILKLGTHIISDINTYMNALSTFKKGDSAIVRIARAKEEKEFAVKF